MIAGDPSGGMPEEERLQHLLLPTGEGVERRRRHVKFDESPQASRGAGRPSSSGERHQQRRAHASSTHLAHLDAAVAVGYDSDVVILMNDKRSIVAANQISNTLGQAERFRQRVVFTVEKNRGEIAPVDVEFSKDFEHFRFDPSGSYVAEQLIEDGEHDDFRS